MTLEKITIFAKEEANRLLQINKDINSVVISTTDGFSITHASVGVLDSARISAITSSIAAMGDVISYENQTGKLEYMIIKSEKSFILIKNIKNTSYPLVMYVLASSEATLGLALHQIKESAERIENF